MEWYRSRSRPLPWRGEADPYRVLVAEVMLQQTQTARVARHYQAFLDRFPTVQALAAAPLQSVLGAWAGLGYNSRAKRLRDAARRISATGWPTTPAELQQLPGVGPYTAAALACFAFGEPVAVVDTNVRRVLSRWAGKPLEGAALAEEAGRVLQGKAADWNQAIMDLGAEVCLPRAPRCERCPVAEYCPGPQGYRPAPRQGRFEGSLRQARGAVLRSLTSGAPLSLTELASATATGSRRTRAAIDALIAEGMVWRSPNGTYQLAD